jgi:hypothetical protein
MAEVVPRWEWRTFAGAVPRADAVFDALTPVSVEESDESTCWRAAGTTSRSAAV